MEDFGSSMGSNILAFTEKEDGINKALKNRTKHRELNRISTSANYYMDALTRKECK